MSAVSLDLTPKGSVEIETLVNGPIQTNSYAVISDNECVIIDPAWEGERLVEHIRAEHPDVQVLGAVCTHGHADHVGGVAGVRAAVGADALYELCGKDAAVPHANIEEQRAMWGIETPDPGEPTRLLAEGDTIELGDICLQVIEVPGVCPGTHRAASFCSPPLSRGTLPLWATPYSRAATAAPILPVATRQRFCARSPSSPTCFHPIPFV